MSGGNMNIHQSFNDMNSSLGMLCTCLVLGMLLSASPALAAPSLDLGSASGKPGSTVTVPVTLTNAVGVSIAAVAIDIAYDTTKLENPTATVGVDGSAAVKVLSSNSPSAGLFRIGVYGFNAASISAGAVIEVHFGIKTSAPSGDVILSNTPSGSDPGGTAVSMTGATGKVTVIHPALSVSLSGTGSGSVNRTPAGVACTIGACTASYPANTVVTMMQAPDSISTFSGWSGACSNTIGNCTVIMSDDTSVTALYTAASKARIGLDGYASINAAYTASPSTGSTTILVLNDLLQENLTINKNIILNGGYNATYSGKTGSTKLKGTLLIRSGSLTVNGLIIR